MPVKAQRIRDPLHNLVEFKTDQFEQTLWKVVQTAPFQRLRRVRQLGFSELVYPGATHTRFAHSVGAYHTARNLVRIISERAHPGGLEHQRKVAIAAALLHDVGHGMFSHAFEDVGKKLKLRMAEHEHVSDLLIRDGEIAKALNDELGSGFANDVANVIGRGRPGNLYDAVVSSQFDADRLDYMQRDRLMTGVQNSGIDFVWLMNNLDVGTIPIGVDAEQSGTIETFVLGSKAFHAAETYVLSLFQLYPTIYYHKTTRGAEKLFSEIMVRVVALVRDQKVDMTGLSENHPIVKFAKNPDRVESVLALDDTVFWGALPMLVEAEDELIRKFSYRLWKRQLLKCTDIGKEIFSRLGPKPGASPQEADERQKEIKRVVVSVTKAIQEWSNKHGSAVPRLLVDEADRTPYKTLSESKGPLNQISIRSDDGHILDMAQVSPVVAGLGLFQLLRVYHDADDVEAQELVHGIVESELGSDKDGNH